MRMPPKRDLESPRRADRQDLFDQDQLDHQRGKQGEGGDVVQKCEQRGHLPAPGWYPVPQANHALANFLARGAAEVVGRAYASL